LDSNDSDQIKDSCSINPIKQAHRISDKTLVIIDETLVRQLAIDENDTWFQQIRTKDGILLKIIRRSRLEEG
jgi:DNA-directed RNA polymerase subunit H (RpoH/RPB5)